MKTLRTEILDLAGTVGAALLIALALRTLVFQPFTIPSDSMEPTLTTGDYLVVSKYAYGWSRFSTPLPLPGLHGRLFERSARRGDVVVFQSPHDPREVLVKRVIGLPGDTVQLKGGVVVINGRAVARAPLGATIDPGAPFTHVEAFEERLPGTRPIRVYDRGPGQEGDDTGPYLVPAGAYFVMGDNRDNSLDSRWPASSGVGFVPAERLIGRGELVLWSWRRDADLFQPWTWLSLRPDGFLRRL